MVIFKKSVDAFVSIGNPLRLEHADGRFSYRPRGGEFSAGIVIESGHYLANVDPVIDPLREKLGGYVATSDEGYIVREVSNKSVEECAIDACGRACGVYDAMLVDGYATGLGFTMDTNREDYRMMKEGLDTVLNSPAYANGDLQYLVDVVDNEDQPHSMTIEAALVVSVNMLENFWIIWNAKTKARANVKSILADLELTAEQKIEALVLV